MAETIRVVIADDEEGYRKALKQVLATAEDIMVAGTAANGEEALAICLETDADVLLTDMSMPKMDGVQCIRALVKRKRDIAFVVLTIHEENERIFDALRAGATGYLLKTSTPKDVVDAIRRAHDGEASMTPAIATKVLAEFRRQTEDEEIDDQHLYELSDRELEILQLVADGLRNREIAARLCLAEKTVKNHVSNILKAMHVNSRTEAAMKALKEKLIGR
ncbi:MAG: response regulator [Fimbriimonadales bacterium]